VEATQRITKKRAGLLAAKARNVELRKRPKLFTKDIIPLFQTGMTVAEVSRKLDKSRQAIYACFQREEVDMQLYLNY
jgi:DNA invertase Pin-like site-specific DNA recombinase